MLPAKTKYEAEPSEDVIAGEAGKCTRRRIAKFSDAMSGVKPEMPAKVK